MIKCAKSPEELAFSYGWASHVVADIIGHPLFTNITHAEIINSSESTPKPIEAYDQPLEHKKTEFGASAYLLGLDENNFLWDVKLRFPFEISKEQNIISAAFLKAYALDIDEDSLFRAVKSLRKEIRRMPIVMKFIGSIKGRWYDIIETAMGFLLRNIAVPLYISMINKAGKLGVIAVLKPFRLNSKQIERLNNINTKIIESYIEYLTDDFRTMKNLNLDTGYSPVSGKSRHGDKLMSRLEEEGIEERFREKFKQLSYLESWKNFKTGFFSS